MLALEPPERDEWIAMLAKFYSAYKIYPNEPALQPCEVERSKDEPTGTGGFADCWEGMFLGRHKIAMKCPHAYIQEGVAARVGFPFHTKYADAFVDATSCLLVADCS